MLEPRPEGRNVTQVREMDATVFRSETLLPHPRRDGFAAVMSPEIAPPIDPAVRRWEPDRRPIGVRTCFTIRGRFQWPPIRATSRVTVGDPPSRGEFETARPTWPRRLNAIHAFEEHEDGTRYT